MLLVCLAVVGGDAEWQNFAAEQTCRAARYAVVQERLVAPDGSYPVTGGSVPDLPADSPFWTGDAMPWTSQKVWNGIDLPADHTVG